MNTVLLYPLKPKMTLKYFFKQCYKELIYAYCNLKQYFHIMTDNNNLMRAITVNMLLSLYLLVQY